MNKQTLTPSELPTPILTLLFVYMTLVIKSLPHPNGALASSIATYLDQSNRLNLNRLHRFVADNAASLSLNEAMGALSVDDFPSRHLSKEMIEEIGTLYDRLDTTVFDRVTDILTGDTLRVTQSVLEEHLSADGQCLRTSYEIIVDNVELIQLVIRQVKITDESVGPQAKITINYSPLIYKPQDLLKWFEVKTLYEIPDQEMGWRCSSRLETSKIACSFGH